METWAAGCCWSSVIGGCVSCQSGQQSASSSRFLRGNGSGLRDAETLQEAADGPHLDRVSVRHAAVPRQVSPKLENRWVCRDWVRRFWSSFHLPSTCCGCSWIRWVSSCSDWFPSFSRYHGYPAFNGSLSGPAEPSAGLLWFWSFSFLDSMIAGCSPDYR